MTPKRSSSALKSPRKASLMCNGWKVFPERWGKRNTEEERGCLKELPWQSGLISLCTYTRTLYLSDSPSPSSHSSLPFSCACFFVLFAGLFPLDSGLGVSSLCLHGNNSRERRDRANALQSVEYVCVWTLKHFQPSCVRSRQKPWSATVLSPKVFVLDQNVSCQSKSSLIMILKHPDLKGGLAEVGHFPQGCLIPCTILHHPQYQMYWIWAMHQTCALVTVKGAILSLKNQSINKCKL